MIDAKAKLYRIIAKQFSIEVSEIDENQGPGDLLGWDSLGQIRLILRIEQEFNLQLSLDNITSINKISDILKIVQMDTI